jgi:hypothetical protein
MTALLDFFRAQVRGTGCSCSRDCDREREAAFTALSLSITALTFVANGTTEGDVREFARTALRNITLEVTL